MVVKTTSYTTPTDTFHQYTDGVGVWGFNFYSADDARVFADAMKNALQDAAIAGMPATAPAQPLAPKPAAAPAVIAQPQVQQQQTLAPKPAAPPTSAAPQAPVAPKPAVAAAPAAPQAPKPPSPPQSAPVSQPPATPVQQSSAPSGPAAVGAGAPPPPPPPPADFGDSLSGTLFHIFGIDQND